MLFALITVNAKTTFTTVCIEDFSTYANDSTIYEVAVDSSKYPTSKSAVKVGASNIYITPPSATTTVFATKEQAKINGGKLQLLNGKYTSYSAYLNKECKFEWRPANYSTVGDTYRLTIDGANSNSNSGFIMRFHTNSDASNCYMLVVPSCNRDSGFPGWRLYKRVSGEDNILLSSSAVASQSTKGTGYLQAFNAEITVENKSKITVHVKGKTNTNVSIDETKTYTDTSPFSYSLKNNYIHMLPYGGVGTDINYIKLENGVSPSLNSSVSRSKGTYVVKADLSNVTSGKLIACGINECQQTKIFLRDYSTSTETFEFPGTYDGFKVFVVDNDFNPQTEMQELVAPAKNQLTELANLDFSGVKASDTVYKIETDASDYPLYNTPVRVADTDLYITPPLDENGKVMAGDVNEKAKFASGTLQLLAGYGTPDGYSDRECRIEWRPSNYKDITNTYRTTIDGSVFDSRSGFMYRFQLNDKQNAYYQFIVYASNLDKPAWEIVKKTEDGASTVLLGSTALPTQSTTGNGYLKTFNATITVTDKSQITVTVTGKSNTNKAINETLSCTDLNPFPQNANEQYMHFKSFGGSNRGACLNSVLLETNFDASASSGSYAPIDYGTVATATTNKMTWNEMDKGYITIIFDDNNSDLPSFYSIITGEYGFPICSAVPTKYIDRNGDLLEQIQASGGEILSHTATHPQLNFSTPWTTVEEEFKTSYNLLTARGLKVNGIILAGGTESDLTTAYARAIEPITAKYYNYSDLYGVSTQYSKPRDTFSGKSIDQLKNIVDRAIRNKSWVTIYAHSFEELPEATLRAFMDYVTAKKAEGKVDIATYKTIFQNFANYESPVTLK